MCAHFSPDDYFSFVNSYCPSSGHHGFGVQPVILFGVVTEPFNIAGLH